MSKQPDPNKPNPYRLAHHLGMESVILGLMLDGAMKSPQSLAVARVILTKGRKAIAEETPQIGQRYAELVEEMKEEAKP